MYEATTFYIVQGLLNDGRVVLKAPPLTVRCFAGYSGFLHYLQLASHELATIGINVTKNKIQIQIQICIVQIHYREGHQHFPVCETDVSLCDIWSLTLLSNDYT